MNRSKSVEDVEEDLNRNSDMESDSSCVPPTPSPLRRKISVFENCAGGPAKKDEKSDVDKSLLWNTYRMSLGSDSSSNEGTPDRASVSADEVSPEAPSKFQNSVMIGPPKLQLNFVAGKHKDSENDVSVAESLPTPFSKVTVRKYPKEFLSTMGVNGDGEFGVLEVTLKLFNWFRLG